jgi:hypothetical protein
LEGKGRKCIEGDRTHKEGMQRGVSIVKDTKGTSVMGAWCGYMTGARLREVVQLSEGEKRGKRN